MRPASIASSSSSAPDLNAPIPLTILTGFLGSGKSTLLSHLLKSPEQSEGIAIILNEFSDSSDIELSALKTGDGEILQLPNGCLCCSVRDTGFAAVSQFAERPGVKAIILETTGLVDAPRLARMCWENQDFTGKLFLDAVVCVTDGLNIVDQLQSVSKTEASGQIALADVIILNKTDLINSERLALVRDTLRSMNPTAAIHETVKSQIEASAFLGQRAYDSAPPISSTPAHSHHSIHPDVGAVVIPLPVLSSEQFERLKVSFTELLFETRMDTESQHWRSKGFFVLNNGEEWVLQGVREMVDFTPVTDPAGTATVGKLIMIGLKLNEPSLRQMVSDAIDDPRIDSIESK